MHEVRPIVIDTREQTPLVFPSGVATFEVRYGVPAVFAHDAGEAAALIVLWARYFDREARQAARR